MHILKNLSFVLILIFINVNLSQQWTSKEGVIDSIRNGLQMAGKFLGLDTASNVAQLINDAFKKNAREEKPKIEAGGIIANLLKLLSFDTSKIGAIVLNSIIFLAQMSHLPSQQITTTLSTTRPALPTPEERSNKITDGSPLQWILDNKSNRLKRLMAAAEDANLTERILEMAGESKTDEDTSCVQQLICRISPFIKSMQIALGDAKSGHIGGKMAAGKASSALFRYLPELEEFKKRGGECKRQHSECRLLD